KLQRAFFSDPIVANDRRDEPTRIGMTVDCRNGGPGIVEEAKICSAISSEPSVNLFKIAPRVHCEVVVQVEARREHIARPGQNNAAVIELGFEAIERRMKIGKERWVLRIDLVCIHG